MLKHNVQFVYADAIKVEGHINLERCYAIAKPKIDRSLDLYNIHAQTVMLHRDIHIKYGLYDENLKARSDREMWWRLFGKTN